MKGKSHDELHKWLHPHMTLVAELKSAENPAAAEGIISDLKSSFETYHAYFH